MKDREAPAAAFHKEPIKQEQRDEAPSEQSNAPITGIVSIFG